MKLRHKESGWLGSSWQFNIHSLSEIIVSFDEGDQDSMDLKEFEVLLRNGTWKDMAEAFKDKDIVPNNLNTTFGYPVDDLAKQRGYNP